MSSENAMLVDGAVLRIGSALPATHDKAGFEALTWTAVGLVLDFGNGYGKTYNVATTNPVGERETVKRKSSFTMGDPQVVYLVDSEDAGQADLADLIDSDALESFSIVMPDTTIRYFTALVTSDPETLGTSGSWITKQTTLAIQGAILNEAAPVTP